MSDFIKYDLISYPQGTKIWSVYPYYLNISVTPVNPSGIRQLTKVEYEIGVPWESHKNIGRLELLSMYDPILVLWSEH